MSSEASSQRSATTLVRRRHQHPAALGMLGHGAPGHSAWQQEQEQQQVQEREQQQLKTSWSGCLVVQAQLQEVKGVELRLYNFTLCWVSDAREQLWRAALPSPSKGIREGQIYI